MYRSIQIIGLTLVLILVTAVVVMGQVQFKQPITFSVVGFGDQVMYTGINSGDGVIPASTYNQDVGTEMGPTGTYKELLYPSYPMEYSFVPTFVEIPSRIVTPRVWSSANMRPYDYRGYSSPTQVDTFQILIKTGTLLPDGFPATGITLAWSNLDVNCTGGVLLKKMTSTTYEVKVANMLSTTSWIDDDPIKTVGTTSVSYLYIKTGAIVPVEAATISMSPNPLVFGSIIQTQTKTMSVLLKNLGTVGTLNVTGITMPTGFALVETTPITLGPSSEVTVHITFTAPSGGGVMDGAALVANNSAVNPYTLELEGTSLALTGQLEIAPIATVLDNSSTDEGAYEAIIQLTSYNSAKALKAIQFTLVTSGKTVIGPISKVTTGPIATGSWVLSTHVVSRTAQPDGSSIDTVNVLLYGNPEVSIGTILTPTPLLKFRYNVINILDGNEQAEMCLNDILGSNVDAADAGLNTSACETIDIKNRTFWGDINLDDRVDILDLLMVADHITGRHLLEGEQITRANVGDWPPLALDAPNQTPPIVINVLDLVMLQSIIMDGHYPDGTTTSGTPKVLAAAGLTKEAFGDTKVTFHVTKTGIGIQVENYEPLKAMQVDFTGIINKPTGVKSSLFTQCSAQLNENTMRVIVFGQNVVGLGRGNRIVATIPMTIANPMTIGVEGLTVANDKNERISLARENGEIVFTEAREIPTEFSLKQNYPNPFNPNTNITFSVPQTSDVRIMIYNMLGQEVRVLFAGQMESGIQTLPFDGKDQSGRALASGTYIYRMVAGTFVESKKMMLLK